MTAIEPPTIVPGSFGVTTGGGSHMCATAGNRCWGDNNSGETGDNTTVQHLVPTAITLPGTNPTFALGYSHSCAVTSSGPYCWGSNKYGQVGDNGGFDRHLPTAVALAPMVIRAGGNFSCALVAGSVYCWGDNTNGQLGIGTFSRSLVPIEVTLP